ncbi:MAG: response regulator transcription factor [Bacteroidetes bacterium]|nr:response regulator transcription factor [Bacteroidota bacterium]
MEKKIPIIIVDDHEIFRNGLAMVINRLKYTEIVGEASNGQEFLELIESTVCDIVFMDIEMPVMNGIEATSRAKEKYPDLKIIALSMFGEEEYLQNMLDAGVSGFLLKNINKTDIDRAIRMISEGKNYFSEELLSFFTKRYISDRKSDHIETKLTIRELEVLQLIAKGLTDQEIADKLFISQRTVNGHRANLISKTGSKNTVNLLIYAIKNKLVDLDEIE